MRTPISMTGFLGRDREIKTTRQKTLRIPARVFSDDDGRELSQSLHDIVVGGSDYVVLSLATLERVHDRWYNRWHRLIVFDVDRCALHPARLCRKGDKIHVTGYRKKYRAARDGRFYDHQAIVVTDLRILDAKAPEIG